MDILHIKATDPGFPDCLRQLADPPASIYVRGDLSSVLAQPRLAVVGSRKPTAYGQEYTNQFTSEAAGRGISIISGLAVGIDALAHQAALNASGLTLAVLGSGLDQITPALNDWLGRRILEKGGALVSEYPPGAEVHKYHFIARNRLIAAFSQAILIPEAAAGSGSLHTAAFAVDLGRSVLAVPGNINAPWSAGTNQLIKTGAIPVTDVSDILLALGINPQVRQPTLNTHPPEEAAILKLLQAGIRQQSVLQTQSQLQPAVFNQTLTMLEIGGHIRALGGGQWALK